MAWCLNQLFKCDGDVWFLAMCFFYLQILPLCHFVHKFIVENPLCVCSEEINRLKKSCIGKMDELKLKQKTSQVVLKLSEQNYFLTAKLTVPDNYPTAQLQ